MIDLKELKARKKMFTIAVSSEPREIIVSGVVDELIECIEKLEAGMKKGMEYYDSTDYCRHNCDPTVGHHEPECHIINSFYSTLSKVKEILGEKE